MTHARRLRDLFSNKEMINAPGVYDGLSARLVEQAGFSAAFISGAGVAFSRFGRPDIGLISVSEVADTLGAMRECVQLPLIVDIDTGFGNALNVQRTVKVFERQGASALQMEDQVMPKRCGHMAGKQVISKAEMVGKIKAALDARTNENTAIIARTDALSVHGFDDALERAEAYREAGADALFIEAPQTLEHMKIIGDRFGQHLPLVHNLVEGGKSPVANSEELRALDYKIALFPVALLHLFVPHAQQFLKHIAQHGSTTNWPGQLVDLNFMNELLGAPELMAASDYYKD